jgi:hypothetical protein
VSLIKQTDPLLRQMRLTEAQAAGRACISMHCETPDAEPTEDEQLTVRVEGVIRVLPVRRCRPCALKQGGYTVIVGESLGGGR